MGNKWKNFNKYSYKKRVKSSNSSKSLFDDEDYNIKQSENISKFDIAYKSIPSELDNISYQKEYSSKSLFNEEDYDIKQPKDISEFDKAYKSISSEFDNTSSLLLEPSSEDDMETIIFSWELDSIPSVNTEPINSAITRNISSVQDDVKVQEKDEKIDRALIIADDFAKRKRLIIVGGAIYIYNGRFFSLLSEDTVQRLIFQEYRNEIGRASPLSTLRNVAGLLRYSINEEFEEFPVNANIIVFNNGTLEIDTGHFRKNSVKDLASSALGIDYNYDCWQMPHTKRFLETISDGDNDLYELMLQVIGYILSNDIKAKSFFYLEGVGDAGKSRFCDLIASFFPISGTNKVARIALQDLGGKFALSNLVNAKLNISEDLPDSPLSPTTVSRIKMISDANRLEAEAKYVQAFSFKPLCKLLFASNHPLRVKEYDAAFNNRVVYIPFLNAIPKHKQDSAILEKMQKELPALFNHAFEAYKKLVANGYAWSGAEKFKPEICIVNSGITINREQVLKDFIEDCCIFDEAATISTNELQCAYQSFCHEHKYQPIKGDRFSRELSTVLPNTVTRIKIGNQKRGFKGIKLCLLE